MMQFTKIQWESVESFFLDNNLLPLTATYINIYKNSNL